MLAGVLTATAITAAPGAAAQPVTSPPEVPADPARTVFTDNPHIVDPRPLTVESWTRTDDGLAVHFTTGTPQCYGVHAHVVETPETVTVELWSGTLPEAVGRACIAIALLGTLDVPLREPVGVRQVRAAG
ncbi:hypothetical protein KEK_21809 [Mycolicibacterium thermoresistibile ATCC 19527]|jgi:hypothetical protein|uniref:Large secreted protein n=3 Tax=Mycolicibacterium thermoresistibile TaxID=1797 RepID=G7CMW4_MYCT3|nr:hypothetical protein KEK_21809 [Mycolicibacterium thermoresistibile ATCC 19527]GAT14267.1 putative uncharacterized protein [Mycolicibacterium thermoresistibile]SNW20605.1 Uncharacterised protein [Mycolicibacterium thermoresistibile]